MSKYYIPTWLKERKLTGEYFDCIDSNCDNCILLLPKEMERGHGCACGAVGNKKSIPQFIMDRLIEDNVITKGEALAYILDDQGK